jgi:hypothetical protein
MTSSCVRILKGRHADAERSMCRAAASRRLRL